jgi:hypothetical protein
MDAAVPTIVCEATQWTLPQTNDIVHGLSWPLLLITYAQAPSVGVPRRVLGPWDLPSEQMRSKRHEHKGTAAKEKAQEKYQR